jgi:orotidine-5'-phosphate decarboxylase
MSIAAGADGLVCSAEESGTLRQMVGPKPLLVTPGIRPAGAETGDQKRIATPEVALQNGASYLVVGRPITQAADPKLAAEKILAGMSAVLLEPLPR